MNSTVRALWGTAAAFAEERGLRVDRLSEDFDGVMFLIREAGDLDSTGTWVSFRFLWSDIRSGELSQAFREYREALVRGFGDTPEEREAARLETQRELGKQKTPFRPGRHRVRLAVGCRLTGYARGILAAANHVDGALGPWSNVPVTSLSRWLRSKVYR